MEFANGDFRFAVTALNLLHVSHLPGVPHSLHVALDDGIRFIFCAIVFIAVIRPVRPADGRPFFQVADEVIPLSVPLV